MEVARPKVVFTVKLPAALARRVRRAARATGQSISALVSEALTDFLERHDVAERDVTVEFVFDRTGAQALAHAYRILVPERRGRIEQGSNEHDERSHLRRVSSARQREEQTIGSQTSALREAAERWGLEVPAEWVFEDEGYSGATLVRPALERLRDLAAQVPVDVVLCYSPDRLARKYAYQALLIDEFVRAGTEVRFVKGPRAETPEDELLIQFQGMIAEYERAQIAERTRRGKAHRARAGW